MHPPAVLSKSRNKKVAWTLNRENTNVKSITTITEQDLENPQRFIAEGLGAPECSVIEAKAQRSADRLHLLYSGEFRAGTI